MMRHLALVLLIIFSFSANPAKAAGPFEQFKIGNWVGGRYTSDTDGSFSHCVAWVTFGSNINLYVTITNQGGWNLGFSSENWNLSKGSSFPIDLTFDGSAPVRVNAFPVDKTMAIVPMPINSALIKTFKEAQVMNAYAQGNIFAFSLEGTLPLFDKLYGCWDSHRASGKVSSAARGPASESPNKSSVKLRRPSPPQASAEQSSQPNSESDRERQKLITEAASDHAKCLHSQMREIVPYSNEGAETLAQVVITKCAESEKKFVSLGMALFNASRVDVEKIVGDALADQKKSMVAEIVSFRAQLNKSMSAQPKKSDGGDNKDEKKKYDSGV